MKKLPRNLELELRNLWKANLKARKHQENVEGILQDMGFDPLVLRGADYANGFCSEALTFFDYNEGGDVEACLETLLQDLQTLNKIIGRRS